MSLETEIIDPPTEEKKNTPEEPPVEEPIIEEPEEINDDDEFEAHLKSKSEHTFTQEEQEEEEKTLSGDKIDAGDEFKLKLFMGFAFMLLDGFHVFVFSFFSKHSITKEEIALTDTEQDVVGEYFKTKQIIELINKLPTWVIGIAHTEYIYFRKLKALTKQKDLEEELAIKKRKAELKEEIKEFSEEEEQELEPDGEEEVEQEEEEEIDEEPEEEAEEQEQAPPPVKRKYKKRKKKPAKRKAKVKTDE